MLSIDIRNDIDSLLGAFGDDTYFVHEVARLTEMFGALGEHLALIAKGGGNIDAGGRNINQLLSSLSAAMATVEVRRLFASVDTVQGVIKASRLQQHAGEELKQLRADIDKFSHAFDVFVRQQTPVNAVPLFTSASDLRAKLSGFQSALRLVRLALAADLPDTDIGTLSIIFFAPELSAINVALKLRAIDRIYTELAELLDEPTDMAPLRLGKIESGSLWLQILGSAAVLSLLGKTDL